MDTGWRRNRQHVPAARKPPAGLLLPEAQQPEHPQGRALLPARLPGLPYLPTLHGDRRFLKSDRWSIIILLSRSMNVQPFVVLMDGAL